LSKGDTDRKSSPEGRFYQYARNIEEAVAAQPDCLAVLKLHYLRWVLFPIKGDTIFPKTPACYGFSILALVHRALAYALNHVMPDKMVLHARCASARSSLKPPLEPPLLPL
jgi:hypothetical protein